MRKTLKIKCIITGKENFFSGDYLSKKIDEYGDTESLEKYYICREVRSLLAKGYKIDNIRNLLNVSNDVIVPDSDTIKVVEDKFKKISLKLPTVNECLTGFTYNKSDSDVESFMNEYIIKV